MHNNFAKNKIEIVCLLLVYYALFLSIFGMVVYNEIPISL